jgi:hypothetical protein
LLTVAGANQEAAELRGLLNRPVVSHGSEGRGSARGEQRPPREREYM